jgi:RNA binding exosome subunit
MAGIVSNIEFQTLVHSTEDPNKVRTALVNVILPLDPDAINISSREMKGHYKNSLVLLRVKIKDQQLLEKILKHISTRLSIAEKEVIASRFDLMSDWSGSLYLRFDKQVAYTGGVRLGHRDPVRVKIKFSPKYVRSGDVYSLCKEIGILP